MQKKVEEFKLSLKDDLKLKDPNKFVNFYSGGPNHKKTTLTYNYLTNSYSVSQNDLQKIIKI